MPSSPIPKGHSAALASLENAGRRSFAKAVNSDLDHYHKTASGRVLVLTYGGESGSPTKRIYLDHLGNTFVATLPPSKPVFRVAFKKAAKKGSTIKVARQAAKGWTKDSEGDVIFGKRLPKPPRAIRDFTFHFLLNIRKIVCPRGKNKVVLGAATTGIVGSLAIWLVKSFGITDTVAQTFASAVLITITTATKGAFCDMTVDMAKAAIKRG